MDHHFEGKSSPTLPDNTVAADRRSNAGGIHVFPQPGL